MAPIGNGTGDSEGVADIETEGVTDIDIEGSADIDSDGEGDTGKDCVFVGETDGVDEIDGVGEAVSSSQQCQPRRLRGRGLSHLSTTHWAVVLLQSRLARRLAWAFLRHLHGQLWPAARDRMERNMRRRRVERIAVVVGKTFCQRYRNGGIWRVSYIRDEAGTLAYTSFIQTEAKNLQVKNGCVLSVYSVSKVDMGRSLQ